MSFLINNVKCDVFAHVDRRAASDTVRFSLAERAVPNVVVYLFCDGKEFPVSQSVVAECCIRHSGNKITAGCAIGSSGEIIVPISEELLVSGNRLSCEINVSGVDSYGRIFRYKSTNFILYVTP